MPDICDFIKEGQQAEKPAYSLSGRLEAIVGRYFVSGEGIAGGPFWLSVYHDPAAVPFGGCVGLTPAHLTAYVSRDYRWAFVLCGHLEQFRTDTAGYGIRCIPVGSFEGPELQCSHPELLPQAFAALNWIDDDFLDDAALPFDMEAFYRIDDGIPYLNPKHFSVRQLAESMGCCRPPSAGQGM